MSRDRKGCIGMHRDIQGAGIYRGISGYVGSIEIHGGLWG